jgi:hypothetical protein
MMKKTTGEVTIMKRILSLIIALACATALYAQEPTIVYCSITGSHLASIKNGRIGPVEVNYGQKSRRIKYLEDERGRRLSFDTMIEALNYMAELGWRLESTYTRFQPSILEGSGLDEINIVMILSKQIDSREELAQWKAGLE